MKLQHQVCTVKQAKRLKELLSHYQWKNVDFNFYWMKTEATSNYFLTTAERVGGYAYPVDSVAAFTVAELGAMLPFELLNPASMEHRRMITNSDFTVGIWKYKFLWRIRTSEGIAAVDFKTEAEARAAMLIYLLENELLTADEANQRLTANE